MHKSLSVVVILALVVIVSSGYAQDHRVIAEAERVSGDRFSVVTRTPRGARIHAVRRPSMAMLAEIDRGLTDLFALARKNGYSRGLSHSDYTIFIVRPDRNRNAAGEYSPDFAIGAAQYAGTVFDKGGYIYVAGMVISNAHRSFAIAEHSRNLDRVANVVRYEGEHIVLYHNDRQRYLDTRDHSKGGGHPILQ